MQSLLKNLLGPIFYGMGVSEADFDSYLSMSMGYVYAILIALVLMIVVMVLARKAKKGTRGFIRLSSLVAFVAAIAVIANMLCFSSQSHFAAAFKKATGVTPTAYKKTAPAELEAPPPEKAGF